MNLLFPKFLGICLAFPVRKSFRFWICDRIRAYIYNIKSSQVISQKLDKFESSRFRKHHCCFPACPQYLQDLRSEKDKLAEAPIVLDFDLNHFDEKNIL